MSPRHSWISLAALLILVVAGPAAAARYDATDDYAATRPSTGVRIDVLGNDDAIGATAQLIAALPGKHGQTRINGGEVLYTPKHNFKGNDAFHYLVIFRGPRSAKGPQPSASDLASEASLRRWLLRAPRNAVLGIGIGRVTVDVSPAALSVRLKGRVYDGPIPGAVVSADVGGHLFSTVADGNGTFELPVFGVNGGNFLTLRADAVSPTGAVVEFESLAGELSRLASEAGNDGILTRAESAQVQVTNLSTANAVLAQAANRGAPITSDAQLRQVSEAVDVATMLNLAAIVQLVVDGGVPLPPGFDSVTSLIAQPAAVRSFSDGLPAGLLAATVAELQGDSSVVSSFTLDDLVGQDYALALPSAPGTINVGLVGGELLFEFDGASGGQLLTWQANANAAMTWSMQGNVVEAIPLAPSTSSTVAYYFEPGCDFVPYVIESHNTRYGLERIYSQAGVDSVRVSRTTVIDVSDPYQDDGCDPPEVDRTVTSEWLLLGFRLPEALIPFAASAAARSRMFSYQFEDQQSSALDGSTGLFNLGTGAVIAPGVLGVEDAAVDAGGALTMTLRKTGGDPVFLTLVRIQQDGMKGDGVFGIFSAPDGARWVKHMLSVEADGSLAFTLGNVPGKWLHGFDLSSPTPPTGQFSFTLNPSPAFDGTFDFHELVDGVPQEPPVSRQPLTWSILGNGFLQIVTGSSTQTVRTWLPLAVSGDISNPATPARIYVLENRAGFPRPNFFERRPP